MCGGCGLRKEHREEGCGWRDGYEGMEEVENDVEMGGSAEVWRGGGMGSMAVKVEGGWVGDVGM